VSIKPHNQRLFQRNRPEADARADLADVCFRRSGGHHPGATRCR